MTEKQEDVYTETLCNDCKQWYWGKKTHVCPVKPRTRLDQIEDAILYLAATIDDRDPYTRPGERFIENKVKQLLGLPENNE